MDAPDSWHREPQHVSVQGHLHGRSWSHSGSWGVGGVANKTAPAVTRETGTSGEKGEEGVLRTSCLVHRNIPGPFSGEKS